MVFFFIDVSADPNGSFCDQTLLASLFAPNIVKNTLSVSDDHIRNNLFKIWICFSLGTWQEAIVLDVENRRQIAIYIRVEPLENSKQLEQRTWKNENIFVCGSHKLSNLHFLRHGAAIVQNPFRLFLLAHAVSSDADT